MLGSIVRPTGIPSAVALLAGLALVAACSAPRGTPAAPSAAAPPAAQRQAVAPAAGQASAAAPPPAAATIPFKTAYTSASATR
jgi:hypothetical protein